MTVEINSAVSSNVESVSMDFNQQLWFGVDSSVPANTILQNNLSLFEWVIRNKIFPSFWGRYLTGSDGLTKDEIAFLRKNGCRTVALYKEDEEKLTEEQGRIHAKKIADIARLLEIPSGVSVFLETNDGELVTTEYMKGYIDGLFEQGFTPGFKSNTDAHFCFDRDFSRGVQIAPTSFKYSLVWATAPSVPEYNKITTTHLIRPEVWAPFAPSGIKRNDIAFWQYGKNCHPIDTEEGNEISFNIHLLKREDVLFNRTF